MNLLLLRNYTAVRLNQDVSRQEYYFALLLFQQIRAHITIQETHLIVKIYTHLIRPPTYVEYLFFCYAFLFKRPDSYLLDGWAAPRQKYIRDWAIGWSNETDSDISLTPLLNLNGVKSPSLGIFFYLTRLWIALVSKKSNVLAIKSKPRSTDDRPNLTQFGPFICENKAAQNINAKLAENICWVVDDSAANCPIALKFGTMVHNGSLPRD